MPGGVGAASAAGTNIFTDPKRWFRLAGWPGVSSGQPGRCVFSRIVSRKWAFANRAVRPDTLRAADAEPVEAPPCQVRAKSLCRRRFYPAAVTPHLPVGAGVRGAARYLLNKWETCQVSSAELTGHARVVKPDRSASCPGLLRRSGRGRSNLNRSKGLLRSIRRKACRIPLAMTSLGEFCAPMVA